MKPVSTATQTVGERTGSDCAANIAPDEAAFHRLVAELLLGEQDFRGAYYEVTTALRLAPTRAESQALYAEVLRTQSTIVRWLLRVHTYLVTSVLCRSLALAAFMAWMLLIAFVAEKLLPREMRHAWAMLILFGFLALVGIVSEPERVTNFIWFFANSGRAVPHPLKVADAGKDTAEGPETRL